jgi:hypothetical protein
MTNLFRRDYAASLLIQGEAWNNRSRGNSLERIIADINPMLWG